MSSKMTQIATLFAAGSFLAATATPLGATPVPAAGGASMEALGSYGSGSCGGKQMDEKKPADAKAEGKKDGSCGGKMDKAGAKKAKKDVKKEKKEGSCGAGSCGGKMEKKPEPAEKK